MAFFGALKFVSSELWTPLRSSVRLNHNRPNLQRPLPPHYNRVRMLGVVKPQYPPKLRVCEHILTEEKATVSSIENNGYALFVARKMRRMFHSYPMIAIFHMNSFKGHDFLHTQGLFFDAKFDITFENNIGQPLIRKALTGTKYEPALPLLASKSAVGFCNNTDVGKLLRLLKKTPHYILIGLIYENKLMHRADIEALAKLPNATALYSNLSHTLTLASGNVANSLQANQIALSRSLSQISTPEPESQKS